MKKVKTSVKRLSLDKHTIASLQSAGTVWGGAASQFCVPETGPQYTDICTQLSCGYSKCCPASTACDTNLCYSANHYLSQCCV